VAKTFVLAITLMFATAHQVHAAEFITAALGQLGIVIIAIGDGLGIWSIVNLLEDYGNDNAGAKRHGRFMKIIKRKAMRFCVAGGLA